MSSSYTTNTNTVTFTALQDSWSEQSTTETNVIGFPGGDAVAISIAGQRETTRSFKALFDSVFAYKTLRDMRGKTGWLLVEGWDSTMVNAVLQRCTPDPILADGKVLATLGFVLY
jgi:hypothetical protein